MPRRRTRGLDITKEEILAQLSYEEESGKFFRISGRCKGKEAAYITKDGFVLVKLNNLLYPAHHIAWVLHNKMYPISVVVHLNGNRQDNRYSNLEARDNPPNRSRKAKREILSRERLLSLLQYDANSGVFIWRKSLGCRGATKGKIAGHVCKTTGYNILSVDWVRYQAHRLAWFYMTCVWPTYEIDHINGVRSDNRWENLREADAAQQSWNSGVRTDNTSGKTGVSKIKGRDVYRAYIQKHGKVKSLGHFPNFEEAKTTRIKAEQELFGEFARKLA